MVWRFLVAMASTSGTKEWSAHLKFYREKCDSRLSNRKYGFPKDCINNFFDFYHGWKLRIDSAISDKEAFFLWSYLTLVKIKHGKSEILPEALEWAESFLLEISFQSHHFSLWLEKTLNDYYDEIMSIFIFSDTENYKSVISLVRF